MRKNLTIDNLINMILFFYILSIYLFSYREGYNTISNALALLLISLIWVNFLITKKRFVFNKFLFVYLFFILICLTSSFCAIDQYIALTKVKTLVLIFILMVSIVNYVDNLKKLIKVMTYYVYSGFITSTYILINSDFSQIIRFGGDLGNVNEIGMIIGISSIFIFYFILSKRKLKYLTMIIINFVVILLTGSRKSLLIVLFSVIMILISKDSELKSKFKNIFVILLFIFLSFYLIFKVPIFYEIIGMRIENLLYFVSGKGTAEGSLNIRAYMIKVGIFWFKERPFTGYGIDNFRFLFREITVGSDTYSHNNVIELLVGTGIFGTFFFYLSHIIVLRDLFKASKEKNKILCYSFIAIIISYTLLSLGLIYYYDKHISILLSLSSVLYRIDNSKSQMKTKILVE